MPKAPKPYTTRKPPEPVAEHAVIEEWMAGTMPRLRPILESFDQAIRKAHPKVHFGVKWKKAHYGLPDVGWIIEVTAYDVSANILFFGGEDLDPPPPLGNVDRSRYLKVTSLEEANSPEVRQWIKQAGKVTGWK